MGQTKRLLEEMTLQEVIVSFYNREHDEDYEYELWKERQLQQEEWEHLAWEEMMGDKY